MSETQRLTPTEAADRAMAVVDAVTTSQVALRGIEALLHKQYEGTRPEERAFIDLIVIEFLAAAVQAQGVPLSPEVAEKTVDLVQGEVGIRELRPIPHDNELGA